MPPLTRDSTRTIAQRVKRDREFAGALLDEVETLLLNGEVATAQLLLRDLLAAWSTPC